MALSVPVIGQGTWEMESRRKESIEALRFGLDLGMTHIDTAEMYGSGKVEQIVGEAIKGRRDEVFLVSKVLPGNGSKKGTVRACEASLERLGTDRLDLYLLHWPGEFPLEETFGAFEALKASGKIRAWGVSNFDVDDLEDALRISGPDTIACNQVLYHLEERSIEHRILPWCRENGLALVAYSPFGAGRFPAPSSRGGKTLEEIAKKHRATPRQVALQFLLRHQVVFTIPKSSDALHVEENARASDIQLDSGDIERIDRAFPCGMSRRLPVL